MAFFDPMKDQDLLEEFMRTHGRMWWDGKPVYEDEPQFSGCSLNRIFWAISQRGKLKEFVYRVMEKLPRKNLSTEELLWEFLIVDPRILLRAAADLLLPNQLPGYPSLEHYWPA